jgi:L-ascorbate metabolism protein UlaG (beta-lactamase superfamily)
MHLFSKNIMITISIIISLILAVYFFMRFYPAFGGKASLASIERFMKSPNYKDGKFINLEETPVMAEDASMFKTIIEFIKGSENGKPEIVETKVFDKDEFMSGEATETKYTWFGHSTVLIKAKGKTIIIDPVFSDHASPFSFTNKSFKYSNNYTVDDLPYIDIVLISHDHYDHLDMNTIKLLDKKVGKYFVPLGVESHLIRWGVPSHKIIIADWWDEFEVEGVSLAATPARHFSGRAFGRSKTLWCSWVVKTNSGNLYFGADSGYGKHFKMIGEKYGPFGFCMIECGQYNKNWPNIHAMPEQSVQASIDLNASKMMAIHWAKFQLALHSWTEPIERARAAASVKGVKLIEPQIGAIETIGLI